MIPCSLNNTANDVMVDISRSSRHRGVLLSMPLLARVSDVSMRREQARSAVPTMAHTA